MGGGAEKEAPSLLMLLCLLLLNKYRDSENLCGGNGGRQGSLYAGITFSYV